jgi:hypothetical protein
VRIEGDHPGAAPFRDDQVESEPTVEDRRRGVLHRRDQSPLDLGTRRRPAGVEDSRDRMTPLAGPGEPPARFRVENRTECDQLPDADRSLVDEHPHGPVVAKSGPRRKGVRKMEVGRILVAADHRRDPALRPHRRRLGQLAFRQDPDPQTRNLSQPYDRREPGDAATEDEDVKFGDPRCGHRRYLRVAHPAFRSGSQWATNRASSAAIASRLAVAWSTGRFV